MSKEQQKIDLISWIAQIEDPEMIQQIKKIKNRGTNYPETDQNLPQAGEPEAPPYGKG